MKKSKKQKEDIFILTIRFNQTGETELYEFEAIGLLGFLLEFELDCPNKEDFDFMLAIVDPE